LAFHSSSARASKLSPSSKKQSNPTKLLKLHLSKLRHHRLPLLLQPISEFALVPIPESIHPVPMALLFPMVLHDCSPSHIQGDKQYLKVSSPLQDCPNFGWKLQASINANNVTWFL
jgi:hypothetical protein